MLETSVPSEGLIEKLDESVKSELSLDKIPHHEIPETPFLPFKPKEFLQILFILLKASIPVSLTYIAAYMKGLICLSFVGRFSTPEELAGASLALGLGNVFLMAILFSINQGFGVLSSHLNGAGKYRDLGVLLQRHLCALIAVSIPLFTVLSFSDSILGALGVNPEVSRTTGIYFRLIMPSFLGLAVSDCMKCFLLAQNTFFVPGVMQLIMLIVHIGWCCLFVFKFDMPFTGPAIAKSITDVMCAIILIIYIKCNSSFRHTVIPWTRECLRGIASHIKKAFLVGFNVYIGVILFEFSVLIVIYINDQYVMGAHSIAIIITTSFFMIPLGNCLAMQAKIGNAVGENMKNKAQKFMAGGLFLNSIYCIIFITAIVIWNQEIVDLFTLVPQTNSILRSVLHIYCFMFVPDTYKDHISGILRTVGREKEVIKTFIICYVLVGVNAQWILALLFKFGYPGVWEGIALAVLITCTVLLIKLIRTDWDKEIAKIQEKLRSFKELKNDDNV